PETYLSVDADGVHDAGFFNPVTGMGDRSMTPNVFFTDVSPGAMTPELAQSMGIRSTESVFTVDMAELQRAGIPVFQNPSNSNIYNAVTDWVKSALFKK